MGQWLVAKIETRKLRVKLRVVRNLVAHPNPGLRREYRVKISMRLQLFFPVAPSSVREMYHGTTEIRRTVVGRITS